MIPCAPRAAIKYKKCTRAVRPDGVTLLWVRRLDQRIALMEITASYGQFCPVAMAAEIVCTRWTALVLRELLCGSRRFNDLRRGVPRMSPTLLSKRLKELAHAGIIEVRRGEDGFEYHLTPAGEDLRGVVMTLGFWGQRWVETEQSLGKARSLAADVGHAPPSRPDADAAAALHHPLPFPGTGGGPAEILDGGRRPQGRSLLHRSRLRDRSLCPVLAAHHDGDLDGHCQCARRDRGKATSSSTAIPISPPRCSNGSA